MYLVYLFILTVLNRIYGKQSPTNLENEQGKNIAWTETWPTQHTIEELSPSYAIPPDIPVEPAMTETINRLDTARRANAQGKVSTLNMQEKHQVKVFIDSGNLVSTGTAISEKCRQRLGIGFSTRKTKNISTASTAGNLVQTGVSETLVIRIKGLKHPIVTKAVVLQDMGDDMNIGNATLQDLHKATGKEVKLEFHDTGTSLYCGSNCVNLINKIGPATILGSNITEPAMEPKGRERSKIRSSSKEKPRDRAPSRKKVTKIRVERETKIKGNHLSFIKIGQTIKTPFMIEPKKHADSLCQLVPGVYKNTDKIGILNLDKRSVTLKPGDTLGTMRAVKENEQAKTPTEGIRKIDDVSELYTQLEIDNNPLLKRDPELMQDVKQLIKEYQDVFSSPEATFGQTELAEFKIKLTENAKPVRAKTRPLNPDQQASLKDQLEKWKEEKIITETESPWASALVPVKKKSGELRWCIDYRPLNAQTIADAYPLPNIASNIDKLAGSKVFSVLDSAGAYHTIPVAKESQPMLAFTTPYGLFTYLRMPFGARNAGSTYSRFVNTLVDRLRTNYILAYIDDLIVHTPTTREHLQELEKTFRMAREGGLKFGPKKTKLFQPQAEYLGFEVAEEGVRMREDYVSKIKDWPPPTTGREMKSFIGFASYYRTFIPNFSRLTADMNTQKNKSKIEWTEEMKTNFNLLKDLFMKKPLRSYPDYSTNAQPFEVWPDYSANAIGHVLQQVQEGERKFIAAGGRKTTKGESNYAPTKGELLAIIHSLRKHEHILRFKRFKIYTDHAPLTWLKSIKNPRGIFYRWLIELQGYEFDIEHIPGKKTTAADGLSRSSHMDEPTKEEMEEDDECIAAINPAWNSKDINDVHLDRDIIKRAQEDDLVLQVVRKWAKGETPTKESVAGLPEEAQAYLKIASILQIDEGGVLVRKTELSTEPGTSKERILIPNNPTLKDAAFWWTHQHQMCGHFGMQATIERARNKFYWPGMENELTQRVRNCDDCLAKTTAVKTHATIHKARKSGFPGERLFVDLVGPLPEDDQFNNYVLTMQDSFSRYSLAVPLPTKEAAVVAGKLLDEWICKFGMPGIIHSDRGTEFKNKLWAELMDRLQVKQTFTPPYNPQSNNVERFHRSLNQIFRICLNRDDKGWSKILRTACFAYNTKVCTATGLTPFEAFFGRQAKVPLDIVLPTPQEQYTSGNQFVKETVERFQEIYKIVRQKEDAQIKRNAKLYTGRSDQFKKDDWVWCLQKRKLPEKPLKITDHWTGPFRIVKTVTEVLYEITPAETIGKTSLVHATRLRPYRLGRGRGPTKHHPDDLDVETDELMEELGTVEVMQNPVDAIMTEGTIPSGHASTNPRTTEERLTETSKRSRESDNYKE